MSEFSFWEEIRRRRNHFFWWWFGWPFAGVAIVIVYQSVSGQEAPFFFMAGALLVWFLLWRIILRRLQAIHCQVCGKPAMSHPYFFMRHAKCQHCGFTYSANQPDAP